MKEAFVAALAGRSARARAVQKDIEVAADAALLQLKRHRVMQSGEPFVALGR